ncbi:TetR/AcrR family transcriptional regulator [Novosphingobium sp.]|uniref:TetR/AcrR family transcriptional regulator n=1 Tax=Novosphingobium sp. TaxID=1874826 RepID=UPI003B520789
MADKTTHKERTRARILDEAARALRLSGTDGVSVADLMKRAGLTHGGFYAHFTSRDDLVDHAIGRMFEDSSRMLERFIGAGANAKGLSGLIDYYLAPQAWRVRDQGCPLPGLSSEAARMPDAARARYQAGVVRFRAAIAAALAAMGKPGPEQLAASVMAEMIGAVSMARSFDAEADGLAWLEACRAALRERLGLDAA